jgi:hypothetical protein
MSNLRFCPHGGATVSGDLPVPDDRADYRHGRVPVFVGCNHLVCSECGEEVRQVPNLQVDGLYSNLPDLNASNDWASLDCTSPGHDVRLYACACRGWLETHMHLMDDPDPEPGDPQLPWRCQGHPIPELPTGLDGAELPDVASVIAAAKAALVGTIPADAPAPSSFVPTLWLNRLYGFFEGSPVAEAMAGVLAEALSSDDALVVGSALRFYVRFPLAPGFEGVLDLAEEVGLATTYPCPYGEGTIDRQVGDAVLSRASCAGDEDPTDVRAVAMTLAGLTDEGLEVDHDIIRQLVREHPEWAARHAVAIVVADTRRLSPLMYGLKDADEAACEVAAGVALAGDPRIDADAIERLLDGSYWRNRPSKLVILGALAKR